MTTISPVKKILKVLDWTSLSQVLLHFVLLGGYGFHGYAVGAVPIRVYAVHMHCTGIARSLPYSEPQFVGRTAAQPRVASASGAGRLGSGTNAAAVAAAALCPAIADDRRRATGPAHRDAQHGTGSRLPWHGPPE